MNTNLPVLASRGDIDLLGYQGSQWVDAETIGRKLGFKFPAESVRKIYQRHKNEFKDGETLETKLVFEVGQKRRDLASQSDSQGRGQKRHWQAVRFRLFSVPKGAFRICMLTNAPNRIEVQDEILELFDTYRFGSVLKHLPADQPLAVSEWYARELCRRLGGYAGRRVFKDVLNGCFDYTKRYMPLDEIAKLPEGSLTAAAVGKYCHDNGVVKQTGYRHLESHRKAMGLPKPNTKLTGKPRRQRSDKGSHKKTAEYKTVEFIHSQMPTLEKKDVARIAGIPLAACGITNKWRCV